MRPKLAKVTAWTQRLEQVIFVRFRVEGRQAAAGGTKVAKDEAV